MKHIYFLLCMLAMVASAHSQDYLKLMSYNIRNAKGMDNVRNVQRIVNVINNEAPDVVAVQELDSMTTRSNQTYVLAEVAERTQMHASYAPAISFQGGKYGIGILSKEKPLDIRTFPLPGREEKRMLMVAEFKDYFFACTHLSLTEEDRLASLEIIKNSVRTNNKPFFLAGDLNDKPESEFIKALQQDFQILTNVKQATFPAPEPTETIDYIAAWKQQTNNLVTLSSQVVEEPLASDHRPITVTLRMAKKADELFLTKPYLQNPADNGMTIMWETTIPAYSWVEYGTDTLHLNRKRLIIDGQAEFNESIHQIRLDNLVPGQTYYYRVCSQEILQYKAYSKKFGKTAQSDFYSFTMPEANTDSFTAVIFNDLHQRDNVFQALLKQVEKVDYDFVELEDGVSYISTEEFIRKMFNPFRVQWKSRIEKAEGKQQYVYEIVDKNYEKPIILRNMPFLSNHLSTHEGVIGVYLDLNKELQPAIQIRYAEPMTPEKLWELMTMETWTITYKADDVRQEGAKLNFKSEGTVYEFTE